MIISDELWEVMKAKRMLIALLPLILKPMITLRLGIDGEQGFSFVGKSDIH